LEVRHINLPKYQDSKRNIGYCHVTAESREDAVQLLTLNGQFLGGRYLKIDWGKGKKESDLKVNPNKISSSTIFIKNLPYSATEDEVGKFFESCGEIAGVRLVYNSVHKHFKG
jgi:RNA recognition motif-containing protein